MMSELLQQLVEQQIFSPFDRQFAQLVMGQDASFAQLFSVSYLSAYCRQGHVCLPLSALLKPTLLTEMDGALRQQIEQQLTLEVDEKLTKQQRLAAWKICLNRCHAVGQPGEITPLILHDDRLYLQRLWQEERLVGEFIAIAGRQLIDVPVQLADYLQMLFPPLNENEVDWQKVAAAVALTRRFSVISGGPGTGKTTTVAKLLLALLAIREPDSERPLRIQLAAPTGKAAARLSESLHKQLLQLAERYFPQYVERWMLSFPAETQTLHRLLGITEHYLAKFNEKAPLHADVVIVDEASMVDLSLMATLVQALSPQTQLILLGDKDQLASVESGSVLGDIGQLMQKGYSLPRTQQLQQLTGYQLEANHNLTGEAISDCLALLHKSYRFDANSAIGQLARAIYTGNENVVLQLLRQPSVSLHFFEYSSLAHYQRGLMAIVKGYQPYLQQLQQGADIEALIITFNQFRLLCALRLGDYGVEGVNKQLTQIFCQQGLLDKAALTQRWYHGRPIMITRNEPRLKLFNGDIGIILVTFEGIRAYFLYGSGEVRSVPVSRLPSHETAFAMTVHKAQGSEFHHCALLLPDNFLPLLTRELFYTGVTRAQQQFTLCASEEVIRYLLNNQTQRMSGLNAYLDILN